MNIAIKPENINIRQALAGKVSLVTGSTSGIGLGIARALAAAGSEIVLNGFGKPEEVADVQAKIASDFKVRVSYSPADMSKPAAIREMIENTLQIVRPARHSRQQCGHPACGPAAGFPTRKVGRHPRHRPVVGLSYDPAGAAFDAREQVGPHHQHRVRARPGGLAVQVGLCRRQARHRRPHQGDRA